MVVTAGAIPQILEEWAQRRGVNIHDPEHLTWWNSTPGLWGNHQSMAAEYNERWNSFVKANPNATASQILNFRNSMDSTYRGQYRC